MTLHHIHKRKRCYQDLQPYPHPQPWINFLDRLLVMIAFIAPLFTLPQIYKILSTQNANEISTITWGAYAFFNIPWIVYGVAHKDKPIIFAYIMWMIMN